MFLARPPVVPRPPFRKRFSEFIEALDTALGRWETAAPCHRLGPTIFFEPQHEAVAMAICQSCPYRAACLEYALVTHQRFGVWGGIPEKGRVQLDRRYRWRSAPWNETAYRQLQTAIARGCQS